jgi:NitT/TauT family transport system ATP-binding protein
MVTDGSSQSVLRLDHAGLTFAGNAQRKPVEVLRDVELEVASGEFLSLIGPSGCGKSTLLALVAGYLAPTSGRVWFDGKPIAGPSRERMMVFQQPTLFPWLTAAENVAYGLRLEANRSACTDVTAKVDQLLDLVQLTGFSHHYPVELSGGMQQRLQIARALAVDPKLLLMDEPLGALDALTRRTMQREVLRIWAETRKTILFVTHDIDEAVIMSDRIYAMAPRPSTVREIVKITLPRPRRRDVPEVARLSRHLASLLE